MEGEEMSVSQGTQQVGHALKLSKQQTSGNDLQPHNIPEEPMQPHHGISLDAPSVVKAVSMSMLIKMLTILIAVDSHNNTMLMK